jgi:prepilin-type N-terminal cleavage/methylation domain-containing protein
MKMKSATKAFSLVELLTVIAIISILSIISMPGFAKYRGNTNLKEAVREISGDIQLCKQRAVAENLRYRLILNVTNNNYIMQKETSPSHWENVFSTKYIGEDDASVKIMNDPAPTFASNTIIFQPRGTTNLGTIVIHHEKFLSEASIKTNITGRVKVKYKLK